MKEARSLFHSLPAFLRAEEGAYERVLNGSLAGAPASSIRGSGYVVHCLEAALWCLIETSDFRSCVLAAVNLGEDADTTGAVAGALAGFAYGRRAIPEEWASTIARAPEIEELAEGLAALVFPPAAPEGSYWVLPGKLLAGAYPGRMRGSSPVVSIAALRSAGVDAFLDLSSEGENTGAESYAMALGAGVERRRVPMADMSADSGTVRKALGELDSMLGAGRTVYVHCVGGMGRTGAVVGSYLAEKGLAATGEALGLLASIRGKIGLDPDSSPQTDEQRRLVAGTRPGPFALPL
jgi:hypothetical protein